MKQIIVIRKDLKMRMGKAIAQGAHASMAVIVNNMNDTRVAFWLSGKFTKVVVYVNSEKELMKVYDEALARGLLASLIVDSGLTEFLVPTTAVAIGPDYPEKLIPVTGHLPLL